MAQYNPELIEQTISIFESRTGRAMSREDARQAVENISGFFRVLQEWAEADDKKECKTEPGRPVRAEGME